jgi:hypothetical protein
LLLNRCLRSQLFRSKRDAELHNKTVQAIL